MHFNPVNKQLEEHKVLLQPEKLGNFIPERELLILYDKTPLVMLMVYNLMTNLLQLVDVVM